MECNSFSICEPQVNEAVDLEHGNKSRVRCINNSYSPIVKIVINVNEIHSVARLPTRTSNESTRLTQTHGGH